MCKYRNINDLLENDSFVRWVKGDSNPAETKRWNTWVKSDKVNHELSEEARFIIESLAGMEPAAPDPSIHLKRFRNAIDNSKRQKRLWDFSEYDRKASSLYMAIAASILIMIVAGIVFYGRPNSTDSRSKHKLAAVQDFKTNYGQKISLSLSDGSRIILNANSEMTFSNKMESKNAVDVWLKGEAYFAIKHLSGEAKRTFIVHTKDGVITDIGTRFSVNTRSDSTTLALVEGAVTISINAGQTPKGHSGFMVHPGELARFTRGGQQVKIEEVNPAVYTSWILNKLTFDHTPMAGVARRIEATYGVKVIIKDKRLLKRSISGSVRSNNLNVLINGLSKILHVRVRQNNNKVIIG